MHNVEEGHPMLAVKMMDWMMMMMMMLLCSVRVLDGVTIAFAVAAAVAVAFEKKTNCSGPKTFR